MKRIITAAAALLLLTLPLSGEDLKDGFSTAGLVIFQSAQSGGAGEIGFPLYRNDSFSLRNHIQLSGYGREDGGAMVLSDKLLFGGFGDREIRTYAFIQGGFGLWGGENKGLAEAPFYGEFLGGGGMDLYTTENFAFFVELGGGVLYWGEAPAGTAHLSAGFRSFLN